MDKPLINVITRFSRKEGIVRSLKSLNKQTYNNIKHYITYETTEGLEYLKSLEYKYPTEFIRVPKYNRIKNLRLYYEHHDVDTDYLNWDWEKWDVQVVYGDKEPPRKEIPCTTHSFVGNGFWCESLSHSLRKISVHAPYNVYCRLAEDYIDEGWVSYLDDDDVYELDNSLEILANEIKKTDEDTFQIFRMVRETDDGLNIRPPDRFLPHLKAGHPPIMWEIGGACICFHSKYKEYTQWGSWTSDDYRTISVLNKIIPKRNIIEKVLYNALKSGEGEIESY